MRLENVSCGTDRKCRIADVLIVVVRQKDDCGLGRLVSDELGGLDSGQAGHSYIEDDDVRLTFRRFLHRFRPIARLTHDSPFRTGSKNAAHLSTPWGEIIRDQHGCNRKAPISYAQH